MKKVLFIAALLFPVTAFAQFNGGFDNGGSGGGGGGSGTVTSIATSCGVSGGTITTTGTISGNATPNAQTGTSYAIVDGDCGKLVSLSNGSAVAVSIAQAGAAGNFASGWFATIKNLGAGTVTITPTTSTIDGAANITLSTNESIDLYSNGTNYITGRGKGGGSGTVTTTGSPASGNLTKFSGATSVTNGDLSGDCTTSGTLTVKCQSLYQQYRSSTWYNGGGDKITAVTSNSTAGGATGRLNCYPGYFYGTATIGSLGFKVNTTNAGNIQAGIYANNASTMRPTGSPLASTASMSMASAVAVNASVSVQITGVQLLWWCSNQDNSTGTVFAVTSGNFQIAQLIGSATQGNMLAAGPAAFSGVTTSKTFGTWDDVSGATWAESAANPVVQFQLSSIP